MNTTTLRSVLLWCTLINYVVLALWGLLMVLPHAWMHRLAGRWYRMSPEQFDTVNFAGIVLYKILIFVFNLVPLIALLIAG
jgi:hypothetical protein